MFSELYLGSKNTICVIKNKSFYKSMYFNTFHIMAHFILTVPQNTLSFLYQIIKN